MAEHAHGDRVYIFVREIMSAVEQGTGAGTTQQAQSGARTGSQGEIRMFPAGLGQIDNVVEQGVVAMHRG